MSNHITFEICIDSVQGAIAAEKSGAQRVELCDNLVEGGTTPSAAKIQLAREKIRIALNVIIRPRGGDFCYSDVEFDTMKRDLTLAKDWGADGLVIGILFGYPKIRLLVDNKVSFAAHAAKNYRICNIILTQNYVTETVSLLLVPFAVFFQSVEISLRKKVIISYILL